jgi:hypothetical protein
MNLKEKLTAGWRKVLNEEFHNFYSLPDITKVIKSRRVRWVEHVVRMRQMSYAYKT